MNVKLAILCYLRMGNVGREVLQVFGASLPYSQAFSTLSFGLWKKKKTKFEAKDFTGPLESWTTKVLVSACIGMVNCTPTFAQASYDKFESES